jgi:c-di-GMP-binding flagellar brake protein YcgR
MLPDDDPGTASRFGITGAKEIGWTLKEVLSARAPVTLYRAADFGSFLVSRLLWHDRTSMRFDFVDEPRRGEALLAGGHLVAVALIERIKIQFDARAPQAAPRDGRMELLCALPDRIIRIQRREAFRVRPPERHPVICVLREPDGTEHRYRVHDISADGVALTVPAGQRSPAPGELWRHGRLEIEGLPPIPCDVEVRTRWDAARGAVRVGCGFHRPEPESQRAIQRYVIDVQRGRVPTPLPLTPACS